MSAYSISVQWESRSQRNLHAACRCHRLRSPSETSLTDGLWHVTRRGEPAAGCIYSTSIRQPLSLTWEFPPGKGKHQCNCCSCLSEGGFLLAYSSSLPSPFHSFPYLLFIISLTPKDISLVWSTYFCLWLPFIPCYWAILRPQSVEVRSLSGLTLATGWATCLPFFCPHQCPLDKNHTSFSFHSIYPRGKGAWRLLKLFCSLTRSSTLRNSHIQHPKPLIFADYGRGNFHQPT